MTVTISPRVQAVAQVMQRFTISELNQLVALVPALQDLQPVTDDPLITYFRTLGQAQRKGQITKADDKFIEGLSYTQYFALSEAEQDAIWEQIFAESTIDMEAISEIELSPYAHMPTR